MSVNKANRNAHDTESNANFSIRYAFWIIGITFT